MKRNLLRRRAVLAATLLALAAPVAAQDRTLSVGKPEDVGMSPGVLEGAVALYRESVARGDLVGAVILIARQGKVVVHEAIGSRNKEANLPMEKNTLFKMASNTKPVIATGIGILADRNQIRYTDLARQYIPSFDNYRSGFIQVRHLLTHTSGFRIPTLFLAPPAGGKVGNLQTEVARFGEVGAVVAPGTSYAYNNPGYNTLGSLIEIRSGKPLEVFLRDEIYMPLGMVDSYHMETADKLDGKLSRMGAVYYQRKDGQWVPGWKPGDPPTVPFVRASGGMISTAWDYALFLQMYLNGGVYNGKRILKEETVKAGIRRQTLDMGVSMAGGAGSDGEESGYGYGWTVTAEGQYSHGGSDGTFAWVDPSRELFAMVFTQTPAGPNPIGRFRQLVNLSIETGSRR